VLLSTACALTIDILLLQETWWRIDPVLRSDCPIPEGWDVITPTWPVTRNARDNGIAILVRAGAFSVCRYVSCYTCASFQILLVRAGQWLVASIYVFCGLTQPDYEGIATYLDQATAGCTGHLKLLLGGDFNYPDKVGRLFEALSPVGLTALLKPGIHITRSPFNDPSQGSLLDNIFTSDPDATQLNSIEEMGPISDHKMVLCTIASPTASPRAHVPLSIAADDLHIDWRALREGPHEVQSALQRALTGLPPQLDLPALHRRLMDTCHEILGTRQWHTHERKPFMKDKRCRALLHLLEDCRKLYQHSKTPENRSLLTHVDREFKAASARAQRAAHMSLLRKVDNREISAVAALARLRSRRQSPRQNPYLDPVRTVAFWSSIFTKGENEPRLLTTRAYCEAITFVITPCMVQEATLLMKRSTPGPDRVPLLLIQQYMPQLRAPLAHAYTLALSEPPKALLVGETILFPKKGRMSTQPDEYRPITLLPTLMRIYYKVIDMHLRALLLGEGTEAPGRHGRRRPPAPIFEGQAGFRAHRSTHEHAFWLHLLLNAQRYRQSHNCLYAAFMDIHKAFDSLDHDCLLDMMEHNLNVPAEWLEIIRRMLVYNTTTVCGHRVEITRGALQGAQISPLFCLIYMDDLGRDLTAFLEEHPLDVPLSFPSLPGLKAHQLLLALLLFADDVTVVTRRVPALARLLHRMGEWAIRRRLRFSPKSFLAILAGSNEVPRDLSPVQVHGLDIQWLLTEPMIKYLGFPARRWRPHWHAEATFPMDSEVLTARIAAIRGFFRCSDGTRLVHIPTLIQRINAELLSKALYPTTVVDIDYAQLDSQVYGLLRSLLQLPKCAPTALVLWELRIKPARLQGYTRALRQVRRIIEYAPWYTAIVDPILRERPPGADAIMKVGPLKRIMSILEYRPSATTRTLAARLGIDASDLPKAMREISNIRLDAWITKVNTAIETCFTDWVAAQIAAYPPDYRAPLLDAATSGPKRPSYLKLTGDRARVGLRAKVPFLRYFHDRSMPVPSCAWCAEPAGERAHHLIRCAAMPPCCVALIDSVVATIRQESGLVLVRACLQALLRVSWRGLNAASATQALGALSHLINKYRQSVDGGADGNHPISAVRTLQVA
jgi:hypothetical protein